MGERARTKNREATMAALALAPGLEGARLVKRVPGVRRASARGYATSTYCKRGWASRECAMT